MEPHTDKQLQTAFEFVAKACPLYFVDDVESFWKIEKEKPQEFKHPTVVAVRSLLLMMGVDPDVHRGDYFWVNVYENGNGDLYTTQVFTSKTLADRENEKCGNTRVAVKRIKAGDTE